MRLLLCGNFEEYYIYAKEIINNTNAKKIILNLSGFECLFDYRTGIKQQTPAVLTNKNETIEIISFLFKNPKLSLEKIKEKNKNYRQNDDGSRNLYPLYEEYYNNPDEYVKNKVIYDLNKDLEEMFNNAETRTFSSMPKDIEYLRKIVELCENSNVELLVINSATPLTSRQSYEGEAYWNFLIQIASVVDFWDFTSYNNINLNPYNFYDDAHPFYEVIDLIIDTIKENENVSQIELLNNSYQNDTYKFNHFGEYLTSNNIYDYIKQRKNDFYKLKEEFISTGTVKLQEKNDSSNLLINQNNI